MTTEYTLNEVGRHCTADDLWIAFEGKVYDLTAYFSLHPGGIAMLRQAGKDGSYAIRLVQMHGIAWTTIEKKLKEHQIGILKR
ncbi:unnamed protein product [Cylicocyclus nassatus]|uniref:Cytochrome b5 heme-binding domain-containing protein n=1 Tax=Cylicocyclus nassatus TaxID=53992 RepID=A0AA36DNZ5_CYLNA|nr:unnamed protein product [Cylicocyclus nassatus]